MVNVSEQTVGQILKPDGTPYQVPARIIGADAAQIMRLYMHWAISNQLEPELFCASCYNPHDLVNTKAQYDINDEQIVITCACQIRFFQGRSLQPYLRHVAHTAPGDNAGVAHVALSEETARLLRLYKKVIVDLHLKEAIRCNACYALTQEDGCLSRVTDSEIFIRCRCSNRTYAGLSL